MARKRYAAEEIIGKLREAEVVLAQGESVAPVARRLGVAEPTYYRWRREYGGLRVDQAKRLKERERENSLVTVKVTSTSAPSIESQDPIRVGSFGRGELSVGSGSPLSQDRCGRRSGGGVGSITLKRVVADQIAGQRDVGGRRSGKLLRPAKRRRATSYPTSRTRTRCRSGGPARSPARRRGRHSATCPGRPLG